MAPAAARLLAILVGLIACLCGVELGATSSLSPVVLVPGVGGSQLWASWNMNFSVNPLCGKSASNAQLWLDLERFTNPWSLDCLYNAIKLTYENTTNTWHNANNVHVFPNDWGGTSALSYLDVDPLLHSETQYFADMITALTKAGYVVGQTLFGAPYDWRIPAINHTVFFDNLTALIESASQSNGNRPVYVITHSLGCLMFLYYLNNIAPANLQTWKDTYIAAWIAFDGPYFGAHVAAMALTTGYTFGIPVSPFDMMPMQRTFGSVYWLLPLPQTYGDEPIIIAANFTFSAKNFTELFGLLAIPSGVQQYNHAANLTAMAASPNVTVYCLFGISLDTPTLFYYSDTQFDDPPNYVYYDDGDGTVPLTSLQGCFPWASQQIHPVYNKVYPGQEHVAVLWDPEVLDDVIAIVTAQEQNTDKLLFQRRIRRVKS